MKKLIFTSIFALMFAFVGGVSAEVTIFGAERGDAPIEIGGNSAASRTAVDVLNDPWESEISCAVEPFDLTEPNGTINADSSRSYIANGVGVNISARNVDNDGFGEISTSYELAGNGTMQDGAPLPASIYTATYPYWNDTGGPGDSINGVLFEFDQAVTAFGAWFGDLETRDLAKDSYPASPAKIMLFDSTADLVNNPLGAVPVYTYIAEADDLLYGSTQQNCGSGSGGPTMCGNETTRWLGFTADIADDVRYVLVTVGDDDDGGDVTVNSTQSNINGGSERLSFTGPIVSTCELVVETYDLSIEKTNAVVSEVEGVTTVSFDVTVSNEGTVAAGTDVQFTDTPPTGFTMNDSTSLGTNITCAADVCTVNADIAAGESEMATLVYTVPENVEEGDYINWVEITSDNGDDFDSNPDTSFGADGTTDDDVPSDETQTADGDPADDDEDSETFTIAAGPVYDLSLTKALGTIDEGAEEVTFVITVMNDGTVDVAGFSVGDTIPAGLTLADSDWAEESGVASITMSELNLMPGESTDIQITFSYAGLAEGETVTNFAQITADDSGEDLSDDDSTPANDENQTPDEDDEDTAEFQVPTDEATPTNDNPVTKRPTRRSTPTTPPVTPTTPVTPAHAGLERCDVSPAVQSLQIWMNTHGFILTSAGNGSLGNETPSFGMHTEQAVMRFQETYADLILTPLGLTEGTGYYGPMTQAVVEGIDAGEIALRTPVANTRATAPQVADHETPVVLLGMQTAPTDVAASGSRIASAIGEFFTSLFAFLG